MSAHGTPDLLGRSSSRQGLAATFRSLRHRNYRLFFQGQLISLLGTWMQATALMWLAYELTHESTWPALMVAGQILPTFLFGAWGGALADHLPKRALLLVTQTAFLIVALALAGLVLSGRATPWNLLALSVLNGLVQAVDLPTRLALVFDLVGRDDIMNAVALNSLLFNLARALGPAIAGWLLSWLGPGPCFLANGLSYLAVLWALSRMDVLVAGPARVEARGGALLAGFHNLAEKPRLALLVVLAGVMALCGWPFMSLLPALAQHTLDQQEGGYSLLLSGTGCGALAAALSVATLGSWPRRRWFIGVGVLVFCLAILGLSVAPNLILAVTACAGIGFGLILFFATSQGVVQLSAGDHNRGRVMGIWAMVLSGAVPLGNLLTGPAADRWGEPFVLRLQGVTCATVACGILLLYRWSRHENSASVSGASAQPVDRGDR